MYLVHFLKAFSMPLGYNFCMYVIVYIKVLFQLSLLPSSLLLCAVSVEPFLFSLQRGIALVAFKMCRIVQGQGRIRQMTAGCVPGVLILLVIHSPGIFIFFS